MRCVCSNSLQKKQERKVNKMIKTFKITFTPVEPYFFGNEKNFAFPGQKQESIYASSYFIRSEKTPSQSTILGALRYIFLPYKWEDFASADSNEIIKEKHAGNNKAVGTASFNIDSETVQDFGIIKKISPVFICGKNDDGEDVTLIPTPMDHNRSDNKSAEAKEKEKVKRDIYSPFDEYIEVNTTEDRKLYAMDFDVKEGLEHSWVSLEKGEIYTEKVLFKSNLRIGINRAEKKDGFFKKEYCMLRKSFAFAVYAELDTDNLPQSQCVFLGQGKSAFVISFEEEEGSLTERATSFIGKSTYKRAEKPFIYCLSDCFIKNFDNESVLFCALDVKDYRAFKTKEKGRVEKGGVLYRLLKAGSIIITEKPDEWVNKNMNSNAHNIGFNNYIISGGQK